MIQLYKKRIERTDGIIKSIRIGLRTSKNAIKIATWNVRTIYQRGKIDNAIQEMASMKVDILGVSEMRWTESGKIKKNDYTVVFSGHENEHKNE